MPGIWYGMGMEVPTKKKKNNNNNKINNKKHFANGHNKLIIETQHDKTTKWHVHPAGTPIRLGMGPVWSESLLSTLSVMKDLSFHLAHMSFCWYVMLRLLISGTRQFYLLYIVSEAINAIQLYYKAKLNLVNRIRMAVYCLADQCEENTAFQLSHYFMPKKPNRKWENKHQGFKTVQKVIQGNHTHTFR